MCLARQEKIANPYVVLCQNGHLHFINFLQPVSEYKNT